MGVLGMGGGCEYSSSGILCFNASVSSFSGRKGNLFVISCMFSGSVLCLMYLYNSLWMVLGGFIMS